MSWSIISAIDKKRIFDSANNGEDFILFASRLNVKASTARKIVSRAKNRGGVITARRGGVKNTKMVDQIRDFVKNKVDENNQITLMAIKQSLEETFPIKPKISLMKIVRILDGHLYSLKSIQAVSVERKSDETKRKRAEF